MKIDKETEILIGICNILNSYNRELTKRDIIVLNGLKNIVENWSKANFDESRVNRNKGKFTSSLKGQDAINYMLKTRKGIIKKAFYRKDIGHIDLIWGDGNKGLSHIIKRREKDEKQNINEFLSDLADVIQKGIKSNNLNENNRWEISLNGKTAIIEPIETNGERTFLLSAFKCRSAK